MKLTELEPTFVKLVAKGWQLRDVSWEEADGLLFLCPVCFRANGGNVGTHSILCWKPHIPETESPGPGRWSFTGTSLKDISLSPSVFLSGPGCGAHFHITNGIIPEIP